jgi:tRNA pseudouridine38-40 synthase
MTRLRLTVAYDGAGFHGFWPNAEVPTVGGTLQAALEQVLNQAVELTCAGRTDAGVHGWGQVVTFDVRDDAVDLDLGSLQVSINTLCGPRIVVRDAAVAPPRFNARASATARYYRYTILNRPVADPFLQHTAWHIYRPLDLAAMRLGCDPLIGHHDFSSFCRGSISPENGEPRSRVRRVFDARWLDLGDDLLRFDIRASSFCHQMVRGIVGMLVDVGMGKLRPGDVMGVLRARDRLVAGTVAPPHGLCLWAVEYPPDTALGDRLADGELEERP